MSEYKSCCRIILRILLGERKPAVQRKDIERFLAWVMWWWRMTLSNKLVTLYPATFFHAGFSGRTSLSFVISHPASQLWPKMSCISSIRAEWASGEAGHFHILLHTLLYFVPFLQWGVILEKQELPMSVVSWIEGLQRQGWSNFHVHFQDAGCFSSGSRKFCLVIDFITRVCSPKVIYLILVWYNTIPSS